MAETSNNEKKSRFTVNLNKTLLGDNANNVRNAENSTGTAKKGRPSVGDVKRVSILVPTELCEGMELASLILHKGNRSAYINNLIKRDLEENLEKYSEFKKLLDGTK